MDKQVAHTFIVKRQTSKLTRKCRNRSRLHDQHRFFAVFGGMAFPTARSYLHSSTGPPPEHIRCCTEVAREKPGSFAPLATTQAADNV